MKIYHFPINNIPITRENYQIFRKKEILEDYDLNSNIKNNTIIDQNINKKKKNFKKIQPILSSELKNFQEKNISIDELTKKIEDNLNYYKIKSKELFDKDNNYKNIENEISINKNLFKNNFNNLLNLNNTNSIHQRKNNFSSSNKSIHSKNIKIIFNPFINKPLNYNKNNLNKYSSIKYKNLFKIIFISIISLGIIIGIIYIFANENIKNEIYLEINKIYNFSYLFYILILFGFLFIILYYFIKLNENKYFIKSAKEDYEIIINNLKEKKLDENYIGIFQNQFIKEISENRNISHEKYLKLIFPKLLKLIKEKNEIYESEIYISDQCQKIWNLNE